MIPVETSRPRLNGVALAAPQRARLLTARPTARPDIQGLRALAVLLVVVFHAGVPLPGGTYGVDVFFAISGFVITRVLVSELNATGTLNLARFYARRIKRLLPALATMLTVVALLGTIASPIGAQRLGAVTGIFASVFGANVYLASQAVGYFDVSATLNPLLNTWTLAVEEQFYVLFPALLLVAWALGGRVNPRLRRLLPVLAVAAVAGASLLLMLRTAGGESLLGVAGGRFAFYWSAPRAWEFGAGALLALIGLETRRFPVLVGSALGLAGLGLLALGVGPLRADDPGFRPIAALLVVGGTCALISAGGASPNLVSRGFSARPLVWIGNLSYSWYLWHWPLIVFARALWPTDRWIGPVAAAVSLLPAWLSFRFVEDPIRFNPRLRGRRVLMLAALSIAVPVAACGGLVGAHAAFERTAALRSWNRVERPHADVVFGCNSPVPLPQRPEDRCTWRVPHPRGTVVLVGDSNAGQFTEPFVRAAMKAGYDATVATFANCPFVDLLVEPGIGDYGKMCRRFFSGTLPALERRRPSLVVMGARSDYYVEESDASLGLAGSETNSHNADEKELLWERGTRSVLAKLNKVGVPAVVAHPVPPLPTGSDATAVIRILLRSSPTSRSRAVIDRRLRRAVAAENDAVRASRAAWTLDFENTVCSRTRCSSGRGGQFRYLNSTHLSVEGALLLTHRFYVAIESYALPRPTTFQPRFTAAN